MGVASVALINILALSNVSRSKKGDFLPAWWLDSPLMPRVYDSFFKLLLHSLSLRQHFDADGQRSYIWTRVCKFLWPFIIVISAIRAIIMILELQRGYVPGIRKSTHSNLLRMQLISYSDCCFMFMEFGKSFGEAHPLPFKWPRGIRRRIDILLGPFLLSYPLKSISFS